MICKNTALSQSHPWSGVFGFRKDHRPAGWRRDGQFRVNDINSWPAILLLPSNPTIWPAISLLPLNLSHQLFLIDAIQPHLLTSWERSEALEGIRAGYEAAKFSGQMLLRHRWLQYFQGAQDPGQRISTPIQFFKLWSHWRKNDGSNLGSLWWKYRLSICAKPNIWNNKNMINWSIRELHGEVHEVDQDKDAH